MSTSQTKKTPTGSPAAHSASRSASMAPSSCNTPSSDPGPEGRRRCVRTASAQKLAAQKSSTSSKPPRAPNSRSTQKKAPPSTPRSSKKKRATASASPTHSTQSTPSSSPGRALALSSASPRRPPASPGRGRKVQYKGNTAELIKIKSYLLDQSGQAPDSIRLESTGQRINKLRQKFRAKDPRPGPPLFLDYGVLYDTTGNVTAPQDANGVLLFTRFAEHKIAQNALLRRFNLADFQEQIILALVDFFQVDPDCYNIQRMDFVALHGGGGNTGSPGSNQRAGQSSGGGQPPASPIEGVAQLLLQHSAESETRLGTMLGSMVQGSEARTMQALGSMVQGSEARMMQALEKMVGASETRQVQSFATLVEALDRRQNDARADSENRLLQAMKHSAEMVLKHSKDYTDQQFNELQSKLVSFEKKLAARWNFNQEESETLKVSLMALEMELSKGASSNNTNEPFTLATGQTGFYADGKLELAMNLSTPARNTPGGRYDDSSQREMGDYFVLTNGQLAFYENGRLCLNPLPEDLKLFRNPKACIPSGSNNIMAKSKGHVHSEGVPADDAKQPPKRARKSLLSDSKSPCKKARKSEGGSSLAAALQSEAGESEAGQTEKGDSPDLSLFFDANQ